MSISRFGFLAIFTSYVVLLLAEYLRPGFVATNGNAHWFWVVMVVWVAVDIGLKRFWRSRLFNVNDREDDQVSFVKNVYSSLLLVVFGALLGLIVWRLGEAFGGMRLLFAFAAAVAPLFLVKSVTTD